MEGCIYVNVLTIVFFFDMLNYCKCKGFEKLLIYVVPNYCQMRRLLFEAFISLGERKKNLKKKIIFKILGHIYFSNNKFKF